jgi:ADP-ribose pyrophosphatase
MRAKSDKDAMVEIICEGKFLRFCRKGEWEYVQRNNCSGIVILVAMTRDRRVILVEQYRLPVGRKAIEFPAGLINDRGHAAKESILSAARRELLEETGYKAKKMVKLLDGPVSCGFSADMVTVVQAKDVEKVSRGGGDAFESIVVHEVPLEGIDRWLNAMKRRGYLVEPKIYTGLYFLKTYNK